MDNSMREPDARRQLADEAAEWLFRLEAASPEERRAFVRWLKRSKDAPDEVLLAKSTDILLRQLLRECPVDLDDLSANANNVTALSSAQDLAAAVPLDPRASALGRDSNTRMGRRRWTWISGLGVSIAAAITLLVIQPPLVSL